MVIRVENVAVKWLANANETKLVYARTLKMDSDKREENKI